MSDQTAKYVDGLYEDLRDPAEAVAYLSAAIEDDDPQIFRLALRDVADAWKVELGHRTNSEQKS